MSASRGSTPPNLRPSSPAHASGRLHHTPSHELLTAHPLLSPGPTSTSSLSVSVSAGASSSSHSIHSPPEPTRIASGPYPSTAQAANTSNASPSPKYLPYTPRQARVVTGSATTGTASSPVSVSPLQHHQPGSTVAQPSATSRLQLQNLKAVAQNHGLDAGCLGWAMLEELVAGTDHAPAWTEIWAVVATGKAALLLPTEVASSREPITPEFMKDHIIFCNGPERENAPVVTLSGLRGTIDGNELLIQSSLSTSSKLFRSLSDPTTRPSALETLPPLPILSNSVVSYPKFSAPTFIPSLPLPPRTASPSKPPLPPRPGAKPTASANVSRLSNPFASFFAKSPTPTSPASTSHPLPDVPPADHAVEVSAFVIDHALIRRNVCKTISKCIKSEIKESLAGVPTWVVDRTQNFSSDFLPFPKPTRKSKESQNQSPNQASSDQGSIHDISAHDDPPEEVSQSFQAFYESLEDELRVDGSPSTLRRKDDRRHSEEERERERNALDAKVTGIMEKVERALTSAFYDRLYRPSNSDDASHDEALSSRIAALNMLDLNLDHLGVDAGMSADDVNRVVDACGETISQLEVSRCPADKAAILVASHRIIVDGLSRLPPLHLKSDEPIDEDKTPHAPTFASDVHSSVDETVRGRSDSPVKLTVSPDPAPPLKVNTESPLVESTTSETIKAPLLDDGVSVNSVPSLVLSPIEEPSTPLLSVSPPKTPTPVSGDILLPLIIFSVVKANPPKLVSHLLYTQRFRNQSFGGEESYCLINLMAVVEFLENVDLGALGLKESEKSVMSTADLTPIPLSLTGDKSAASTPGGQAGLRGRVEQQVDAIAGSANKVLSGVVDSGFGVLRSLLPMTPGEHLTGGQTVEGQPEAAPWNNLRPGFGLLRRESGFSIASLAASLPGAGSRERARSIASSYHAADDEGQEMVESRPSSVRNMTLGDTPAEESKEEESAEDGENGGDEEEDEEDEEEEGEEGGETKHDTRSIRSFESMMSGRSNARQRRENANVKKERMSLTDRLSHMTRLTKGAAMHSHESSAHQGSPPPRSSSLFLAKEQTRFDSPISSRNASPIPGGRPTFVPPPSRRFLECTADDLKMSEIPELLQEYRRLVESMRSVGAFDEQA